MPRGYAVGSRRPDLFMDIRRALDEMNRGSSSTGTWSHCAASADPEAVDGDATAQRQEREYGPFSRTVVPPFRVDANRVFTRSDHGGLTLELLRPESDKPRHIEVGRA